MSRKLLPKRSIDICPIDGVSLGQSPIPGLSLKNILFGFMSPINRIAWSPNGLYIAAPCENGDIYIVDVEQGEFLSVLKDHKMRVSSVAWSPDGRLLASSSDDGTVRVWETDTWASYDVIRHHDGKVKSVVWSRNSQMLASGSRDKTILLWSTKTKQVIRSLLGHRDWILSLAWSPDGNTLASGSRYEVPELILWDSDPWNPIKVMEGHTAGIFSISWSKDGKELVTGSEDRTIRVWNVEKGSQSNTIESHTDMVTSVSFSFDGSLLASKSCDETFRLWLADSWQNLGVIKETISYRDSVTKNIYSSLSFHPISSNILATLGERDRVIRIWEIDLDKLQRNQTTPESVRYTTAKMVLVGDSGVGKTSLGWRLAHGKFINHHSTHGQQFWIIDQLQYKRKDGTDCEVVLWDLAGQHIYRAIHAIFLEDVDISLVLFDSSNRQDPFKGVQFWLEQLAGTKKLPPTILIGARMDRGSLACSSQEITQLCQRYGITGGYIGVSAMTGDGLDRLLDAIKAQIPWEQMETTVTTVAFKRIKQYVLSLKEIPDRSRVLINLKALREKLQTLDQKWNFSDSEMRTALKHLENHGYIAILRSSMNEEFVLLKPELLISLASSIYLQADKHPQQLGALNENKLLSGDYKFSELNDIEQDEQRILLDTAILRFLRHNICLRETLGNETLLIFPDLIKQKRPLIDDIKIVEDTSYIVRGRVVNVYAALVVLLGYTPTFTRTIQWQNQALYEMKGEICGFRLIEEREGEIEFVLYYTANMPEFGRKKFQGLFEEFLYQHDVQVTRIEPVVCSNGHLQQRNAVINMMHMGFKSMFCAICGAVIQLETIAEPLWLNNNADWIQQEEALAHLRSMYEGHLVRVKSYRRDRAAPCCYISYLPDQTSWVSQLTHDLQDAGIFIIKDKAQIKDDDYMVIVDTPNYQQCAQKNSDLIIEDIEIIRNRLKKGKKSTLIPLSYTGDFNDDTFYVVCLLDLVLMLYAIPLNDPNFEQLRQSLKEKRNQISNGRSEWNIENKEATNIHKTKDTEQKPPLMDFIELTQGSFLEANGIGERHTQMNIFVKEGGIITGDRYEISGQAGSVGPNAHAHDMNWTQVWNQSAKDIDLGKLASDLVTLRSAMRREATTAEQDLAVGEVASAEVAAKKGDGEKTLKHLKSAGKWALSCAEKIGVPVAIAALKAALSI